MNAGNTTHAWHGADQRAFDASALILMGARLYNSTTCAYPQDPIGMNDISGLWKSWSKV